MVPVQPSPNLSGEQAPPAPLSRPSLTERLFAPVDIAPLVWFRVAFGLLMLWEVWRYFAYGRIYRFFLEPADFFTYYGFSWVHPWPVDGMLFHFGVLGALSLAIALGLFYRLAAGLFFLAFTYVFLLDQARYLNHFYLICLYSLLLIFVPAHHACSLDVKLRPKLFSPTVPAWSLWLLQAQIGIVYFMGGVAKLNGDWLRGEPLRMWLAARADFPVIGQYFQEEWMVYAFSYGGLLLDLLIYPMVLWRRTRWLGFLLGIIFNLTNARLFRIGVFPWLALGAIILLFATPSRLPHLPAILWGKPRAKPGDDPRPRGQSPRVRQVIVVGLACWLAFQILVPLRHLVFYPGNPEWTEEGHRFSWRMKLRSKKGKLELVAHDPLNGDTWTILPSEWLTEEQSDYCATHPDMLLQFCHFVAENWQSEHQRPLEVRARNTASLNGRPMVTLIDPEVDLAKEPRNLKPARWIKPLTIPLKARPQDPTTAPPAAREQGESGD